MVSKFTLAAIRFRRMCVSIFVRQVDDWGYGSNSVYGEYRFEFTYQYIFQKKLPDPLLIVKSVKMLKTFCNCQRNDVIKNRPYNEDSVYCVILSPFYRRVHFVGKCLRRPLIGIVIFCFGIVVQCIVCPCSAAPLSCRPAHVCRPGLSE